MATKKYGVRGKMEWQCTIHVGAAKFHYHFKDGGLAGNGVSPATFITSNEIHQHVIENSDYFKKGAISLVRTYGDDEAVEESSSTKVMEANNAAEADTNAKDKRVITVTSIAEAKEVLEAEGVSGRRLVTKNSILKVAEELNIEFKGLD